MTTSDKSSVYVSSSGSVDAAGGLDPERLGRLDSLLAGYVGRSDLPGWSLLVSRRGSIVHRANGGLRDVEAGEPVRDDTIFRIYSMTKPITSVAVMMLFEQGAFELTDPVSKYLPEFADMRVWNGGSDIRPVTVPATEPIRIWHLLSHTSGLTYGFHHAHPVDAIYRRHGYEWGAPRDVDLAGAIEAYASMPLLFQPGAEWNYSVATDVLGRLVEVVAKAPLDEALRSMILEPLGMHDTFFRLPDDRRDRLAALYLPRPGGGLVRNDTMGESVVAPWWFSGGGGLSSTVLDYHRFTQFLLGRGELEGTRLLGDRTVGYMTRNHLPGGVDLKTYGRPLFAESPFDGVGFGLGFAVNLDPAATHTLGTAGEFNWGGAASTSFWVDPVEDLTVVFMTQLLPSSTFPLRSQLRQLVYSAFVDRPA